MGVPGAHLPSLAQCDLRHRHLRAVRIASWPVFMDKQQRVAFTYYNLYVSLDVELRAQKGNTRLDCKRTIAVKTASY